MVHYLIPELGSRRTEGLRTKIVDLNEETGEIPVQIIVERLRTSIGEVFIKVEIFCPYHKKQSFTLSPSFLPSLVSSLSPSLYLCSFNFKSQIILLRTLMYRCVWLVYFKVGVG